MKRDKLLFLLFPKLKKEREEDSVNVKKVTAISSDTEDPAVIIRVVVFACPFLGSCWCERPESNLLVKKSNIQIV